jgi:hypothetical protein
VQVNEEIRFDSMDERTAGHLFGLGRVAYPIERISEPAHEAVVLGRANRGIRDCLAEEFRRGPGRLTD